MLIFGALGVGLYLVIRDTSRQRGNWGMNFKQVICTHCDTPMPMVRKPANWRQALWGVGRAPNAVSSWISGVVPVETQNTAAKWAVLRAAEEAEEDERRPPRRDKRIREANDQTKREE